MKSAKAHKDDVTELQRHKTTTVMQSDHKEIKKAKTL